MRWFRRRLYVTARNKSGIVAGQGLRCLLLLPWTALLRCRKALTLPILVAFAATHVVNPEILPFREIAFVAGVAAGAHLCMIVALLVAKRQLRALLFLPLYVLFRVFQLYVAFEALLSLELGRPRPDEVLVPAPASV